MTDLEQYQPIQSIKLFSMASYYSNLPTSTLTVRNSNRYHPEICCVDIQKFAASLKRRMNGHFFALRLEFLIRFGSGDRVRWWNDKRRPSLLSSFRPRWCNSSGISLKIHIDKFSPQRNLVQWNRSGICPIHLKMFT